MTASDPPVSDAERQRLAQLYTVDQELWRVPIPHFTGADGSLYIADFFNGRIRRIDTQGIITTFAGSGFQINGLALQVHVPANYIAVGPDGALYVNTDGNFRVRRINPSLPGFADDQLAIASEDGLELYQFDAVGRHQKTLHALTGATLYEFFYDTAGRLVQVKDGNNNVTAIVRNGSGNPTAIVGPFGQQTTLTVDANGYLASTANPAGEPHHFTYSATGLMTTMQDPKNNAYQFTYDALGRLTPGATAGWSSSVGRDARVD